MVNDGTSKIRTANSNAARSLRLPGRVLALAAMAMLPFFGATVWAAPDETVHVQLSQLKVTQDAQGVDTFGSADKSKPGDVLEYRALYANTSPTTVNNLQATLPIPGGTDLIADTAKPSGAEASLDGKVYAAIPLKRQVEQADGTTVTELVPYSAYRFLRWTVHELKAGKDISVSARVRLENTAGNPAGAAAPGAAAKP